MAYQNVIIDELQIVLQKCDEIKSNLLQAEKRRSENKSKLNCLKDDLAEAEHSFTKNRADIANNYYWKNHFSNLNENLREIAKEVWSSSQEIMENATSIKLDELIKSYEKIENDFENIQKLWNEAYQKLKTKYQAVNDSILACEPNRQLSMQQHLIDNQSLQIEFNNIKQNIETEIKKGETLDEDIKLLLENVQQLSNNIESMEKENIKLINEKTLYLKKVEEISGENAILQEISDYISNAENEILSILCDKEILLKTLAVNNQYNVDLREKIAEMKESNKNIINELTKFEESLNNVKEKCKKIVETSENELKNRMQLITEKKMLLASETDDYHTVLNAIGTKQENLDECNGIVNNLQVEIKNLANEKQKNNDEIENTIIINQSLQIELNKTILAIEENQKKLTENETILKELINQNKSKSKEIENHFKELEMNFQSELKTVEDEISQIDMDYKASSAEIRSCEQQIKELENEIRLVEDNIAKSMSEMRNNSIRKSQEIVKRKSPFTIMPKMVTNGDDSASSVDERYEQWRKKMKKSI